MAKTNNITDRLNIIIDTSILRKDRGLMKSDILLISKLSQLELVTLHIPWIVYKESTSQNEKDISEDLDSVIRQMRALDRKGIASDDYLQLERIAKEIEKIHSSTATSVNRHWKDFISESKAILHEIAPEHGREVMSSYFIGASPFPIAKSRKDIPDAFIFEALKSIQKMYGPIFFICEDKNLREAATRITSCHVFYSYDSFYTSPEYKAVEAKYQEIEHFADELILIKNDIGQIAEFAMDEIYGDMFAGDEDWLIFHEVIPSEGRLIEIENASIESISVDNIQFVNGFFYVPVQMSAVFWIEYFVSDQEYYSFDPEREISMVEPNFYAPYYLVAESFSASISFKCSVSQESIKSGFFKIAAESTVIDELLAVRST